jgi:hypothetical protein
VPGLGRFIGTDPVTGGNANTYNYPADPLNANDYPGKCLAFTEFALMDQSRLIPDKDDCGQDVSSSTKES